MSRLDLTIDTAWMDDAACRGADPNTFFPERGAVPNRAYRICATCQVTDECEQYAATIGMNQGVWGGLSFGRRAKKKREKAA